MSYPYHENTLHIEMLPCFVFDSAVDHSEGLALACLTWRHSKAEVFNIPYCHSFGFHTLILSSLSWNYWIILLPFGAFTLFVYYRFVLNETFVYLWLAWMPTHLCISAPLCAISHTHMGLVKTCPNSGSPESSRRSLGLGPLQLATGSHDSNNRVASQLQGTAKLFSPKEPDWRKMSNYGLRDWMNDYSSAVF